MKQPPPTRADLKAANEEVRGLMNELSQIRAAHAQAMLALEARWAGRCRDLLISISHQSQISAKLAQRIVDAKP